jgi:ribonuclease P protein component
MQGRFRLRASASFQAIRRDGRVLRHPLLVVSWLPNDLGTSRFGFSVGRRLGKAVKRNQVKRWMRESVRLRIQKGEIVAGWDVVLVARHPMSRASFAEIDQAIGVLLRRAGLTSGIL